MRGRELHNPGDRSSKDGDERLIACYRWQHTARWRVVFFLLRVVPRAGLHPHEHAGAPDRGHTGRYRLEE
jgi:hypothetical protein